MLPIETKREGDKITKVCVEDVYKLIGRIQTYLENFEDKSSEISGSAHKDYLAPDGIIYEGELIIGKGTSCPCGGDVFDEEIGNEVAFRKAKLNANNKKARIIEKLFYQIDILVSKLQQEYIPIVNNIYKDEKFMSKINPDFKSYIYNKLLDIDEAK